jgi:hypothetical protein
LRRIKARAPAGDHPRRSFGGLVMSFADVHPFVLFVLGAMGLFAVVLGGVSLIAR